MTPTHETHRECHEKLIPVSATYLHKDMHIISQLVVCGGGDQQSDRQKAKIAELPNVLSVVTGLVIATPEPHRQSVLVRQNSLVPYVLPVAPFPFTYSNADLGVYNLEISGRYIFFTTTNMENNHTHPPSSSENV